MTQTAHSRYQILEKIASGSFATVYRGRDLELGRDVAIKQIHEQYLDHPKQLERYWHEARILAEHQHPNIVTIYDIVRERGWLILELMQGSLLKVAGRKSLDVDSVRGTLAHCLRALKFLHAHGIVHGDIKPSNMMIDRRKRVKLGDFGLARRVSDDEGSLVKGTTKYMAPEVVSEEFGEVGPASDLYSLGFAAYELLCGENFESLFPGLSAYGRDKQIAWMMWHAAPDRKLPDISRVLEGVPEDLARCVQRLIAKPLNERYRNADQALADLHMDKGGKGESSQDDSFSTVPKPDVQADRRRWLVLAAFSASVLMSVMVLFWDSLTGSGNAAPEVGISGVVREINPKENSLTLEDETGYPNVVPIDPQTRFLLVDDQTQVFLKDLKPGDRLETPKGKKNRRPVLDVLRPKRARGKIDSLDIPAHEVRLAANAFNAMQERVRRFLGQRTQMLAGVSHDLRTPLTRMRLTLAMLPVAEESRQDIADLTADLEEMDRMIGGYLAFARGVGEERSEPTDLSLMLSEVAARARRSGAAVALTVPEDLVLPLRADAFRRAVTNLVDNARRHARHVALAARAMPAAVEVTVDDDGPGIAADRHEEVFRAFEAGPGGGTGLGMTIARDIVRAHGGEIALETAPLGGLRVRVTLPV